MEFPFPPTFSGLIVLTSVLLALLQYFDTSHKEAINKIRDPLKTLKFSSSNIGMKKVRELWDNIFIIEIIRLGRPIIGVYIALILQIGVFSCFTWSESLWFFSWAQRWISSYVLILYIWAGISLCWMKMQKADIASKAKDVEDKYLLVSQTIFDAGSSNQPMLDDEIPF